MGDASTSCEDISRKPSVSLLDAMVPTPFSRAVLCVLVASTSAALAGNLTATFVRQPQPGGGQSHDDDAEPEGPK